MRRSGAYQIFEQLQQLKTKYGIADKDIYNFDETGFAMRIVATAKVCSSDCSGKPNLTQPGNRGQDTFVECVKSTDLVVPPLIIFKSGSNQTDWYKRPNLPDDWSITPSPNGWISDEISLQWVEKDFEPFTKPQTMVHIDY